MVNANSPRKARIVIIDEQRAIIAMMTPVIESAGGCEVVASVQTPKNAVDVCRSERPDIIIVDLMLSKGFDLALLEGLREACPAAGVLVFSSSLSPMDVRGALSAGVLGIVEKTDTIEEFSAALLAVRQGRAYFSTHVSELVKNIVVRGKGPPGNARPISRREQMVLTLIAEGHGSREIAAKLGISVYTVLNHRASLTRKTGLHGVAQLSLYAVERGLVRGREQP